MEQPEAHNFQEQRPPHLGRILLGDSDCDIRLDLGYPVSPGQSLFV